MRSSRNLSPSRIRRKIIQTVMLAPLITTGCAARLGATRPIGNTPAMLWRACSRLGYGPTATWLDEIGSITDLRAWAMAQIAIARSSSQQPANIPEELAECVAPLPQLFAGERAEHQERRRLSEEAKQELAAQQAEAARRLDFDALGHPAWFARRVSLKTAMWRLCASSDPRCEHPLLARMTEFWFNHFNVFEGKASVRPLVGHYQVHVIRRHALGRFEDLLLATARHPAMLRYLDQAQSVAEGSMASSRRRGLNENYAREVMELHTLGVDGGYTQEDVRALARILTGWTIDPDAADGFRFDARFHDSGEKRVLGRRYPAGLSSGEAEGIAVLRDLAHRPATARRIALRLAHFFVSENPPDALIQQLAQRFLATQGDIAAVMETLFASDAFWDPGQRLFKTPLDYACAALAALAAGRDKGAIRSTLSFLADAGQPLNGWATPDGYPFDAATWMTPQALARRADYAFALARNRTAPRFLETFLEADSRVRIGREKAQHHAALMLSSPEFMWK